MRSKKKSKKTPGRATTLRLALPATSANLGPAFDAAALAIDLYLSVDARPSDSFAIEATGRDAAICQTMDSHLIITTYREVLESQRRKIIPLSLRIKNNIPIGKGCGSSAAARLAGIALANHFGSLRWQDAQIIGEASRREHHPDNAAACWMGGLTVARMSSSRQALVVSISPKGKWPLLLAIPEQALSTEEARWTLPAQYSRADAVANIQNSMLLLAALAQGRRDLLASALEDRIHQPYRSPLCPLLPCLQKFTGKGVLGVALSGAGPSVIIFLDPKSSAEKARISVGAHLARQGLRAELLLTSITLRGAGRQNPRSKSR
jgi:homoserine kinase